MRAWARFPFVGTLFAAAVFVPLVLFVLAALADYRRNFENAEQIAQTIAATLHEHALKVFETHELVLDRAMERIEGQTWETVAAQQASHYDYLNRIATKYPQISNVLLIDRVGTVRVQALIFPSANLNVSDRDYFGEHVSGSNGTVISKVLRGRATRSLIFGTSRRRSGPNGEFDGVVFVGMLPEYFAGFWRTMTAGSPYHSAILIREDGEVLARYPSFGSEPARIAADRPLMVLVRAQAAEGVFHTKMPLDDVSRIVAVKKLENYPIYVAFAYGYPPIMQTWRHNVTLYGLAALLTSLALVSVIWFAVRQLKSEQRALATLLHEQDRRKTAEASLLQSQKMDMLGQMVGGIAHDFGNLIQIMSGTLTALAGRQPNERLEERLRLAQSALRRGHHLMRQLLAFARKQPLSPTVVQPNDAITDMLPLIRQAVGNGVRVQTSLDPQTWAIAIDINQLELALLNLTLNASQAMPNGGMLKVQTGNQLLDGHLEPIGLAGEFATITVSDTGTGMTPEVRARVLEPFFTTKGEEGTGLGLPMVYGFAKQSGGGLAITSAEGHGTSVTLFFPRTDAVRDDGKPENMGQTDRREFSNQFGASGKAAPAHGSL